MRTRFGFVIALTAIVALVLAVSTFGILLLRPMPLAAAASECVSREITVIGKGEARAKPDSASVYLGVTTEAASAKEVLAANNAKLEALVAQLKASGIAEQDIRTSSLSIYPTHGPGMAPPMEHGMGSGQPAAYQATNGVEVIIRNVDQANELLSKVVEAGANNLSGINFRVADPAALEQAARDKALQNARERAEALAKASGRTLGEIRKITENVGPAGPYGHGEGMAAAATAAGPVQPGEQVIPGFVQVTFELR